MREVLSEGELRETRSGTVISKFDPRNNPRWDLRKGFPITTAKKLAWKAMVGELLWFLNGETSIKELRYRTNLNEDKKTIWCPDSERWGSEDLGVIYGAQWREVITYNGFSHGHKVDQIANLVDSLKTNPYGRRHIVSSWNASDIDQGKLALEPCHWGFQCYVSNDGYLDLKWNQRSWDLFLGAPFNISSYALLMVILGNLTGLSPRYLSVSIGDAHIYEDHKDAVIEYLSREPIESYINFKVPNIKNLSDLSTLTAEDFNILTYNHKPPIKAPVLVG